MTSIDLLFRQYNEQVVCKMAGRIRMRGERDRLKARELAEDAVQKGWLQLVARGVKPEDRFPGLIMQISFRAYVNEIRKYKLEREESKKPLPIELVALGWGARLDESWWLPASILTPQRLEAWVLRQQGKTYQEIAEAMGLPTVNRVGTVLASANASLKEAVTMGWMGT